MVILSSCWFISVSILVTSISTSFISSSIFATSTSRMSTLCLKLVRFWGVCNEILSYIFTYVTFLLTSHISLCRKFKWLFNLPKSTLRTSEQRYGDTIILCWNHLSSLRCRQKSLNTTVCSINNLLH